MVIRTKPEDGSAAYKVVIDWTAFERHRELTAIPSAITPSTKKQQGTTLILSPLREAWTPEDIDGIMLHLAPLVQPFPVKLRGRASTRHAEDFQILVSRAKNGDYQPVQGSYQQFFNAALAKITGWVDANGRGRYALVSERFKIDEEFGVCSRNGINPTLRHQWTGSAASHEKEKIPPLRLG